MKVSYQEIADAAGVSLSKVEGDKRAGRFDKQDLKSIALYIANAVKVHAVPAAEFAAPADATEKPKLPGFDWES